MGSVMQAFWHGPVTAMERLSAASFLAHGHEVHVYSYGRLEGLPAGVEVRDAAEVLPRRSRWRLPVFRDSYGSFSNFSDAFRYTLLRERGGWWMDLDMVCLKPLEFEEEYVLATEPDETAATCIMRLPAGSEVAGFMVERILALGKDRHTWGTTGPRLFAEAVEACGLQRFMLEPSVLLPVDWPDWEAFLDPEREWSFRPETRALHLWNSLWAKAGRDRNGAYPPTCLYEVLKRQYNAG